MFSVIIPTLNEEKFLPNLLQSLTQQSEKDFEVIVVDGSSKDKTVVLAKQFPGVKILISKKASLPLQRNMGARVAKGEWLLFVDADTILLPYAIERVKAFVRTSDRTVFTSWCLPDSTVSGDAIITLFWNIVLEGSILFKRPLPPGPFSGVRADIFRTVGGYNENHAFNEDVEFGLRLDRHGHTVAMLREGLYHVSLRRFRKQGTLRVIQQYMRAALPVLVLKRPLNKMSDYIMGGHTYTRRQPKKSLLKVYEKKLKQLFKEFFD